MQSKLQKTSSIVLVALFLFICALFFFLFREINNNIEISKQDQVDLKKEEIRRKEIKDFNNSFKLIEKEKTLFETHFAQSSDIVPFLNTIEKMASSVGTVAEVSFVEVTQDKTGLILEMRDVGAFSRVYKFLTLLENSPYELEFVSVDMNSIIGENKKGSTENVWEAKLRIKLISFI